ncbi:MAG TPA: response regulator, partial [Bacteroidota bacterium]|nr:response regulator [Bacteroidota bacterium]
LQDKIVLLVDDEPAMLAATKAGLTQRGFKVEAAQDADSALKVIQKLKPSIVVSDLVMPGTNGFELCQQVRKVADLRTIPFVFLTGVDDYHARKFGKEIGGAAYITKPVDLDELADILREKIGGH